MTDAIIQSNCCTNRDFDHYPRECPLMKLFSIKPLAKAFISDVQLNPCWSPNVLRDHLL